MDEVSLYKKHFEFHSKLDYINIANLSRIKEISKRIHFACISTDKQVFDNKGNLYHREKDNIAGDYINNLTLNYTIIPKKLGLVYGKINVKTVEEDNGEEKKKANFHADQFTNYARFIADLMADKVIYSVELDNFLFVKNNSYEIIDDAYLALKYPVDKKHQIDDFLEVMTELYRDYIEVNHGYNILPYAFAGNDFVYHCKHLKLEKKELQTNELYAMKYDVNYNNLDFDTPSRFYELVTENEKSKHNLKLVHAYSMYRKMELIQAEKWFLFKDFGRSGKGLFITTFNKILQVNKVNFDSLLSKSFESVNEWMNFYGADIAHANETGEITKAMMRILRKIATGEIVSGRGIGNNTFKFKNNAVLILDTNENVDTGDITANTTRTIKIAFKDRPHGETDYERYQIFKPYWNFVKPNDEDSENASVSFLITSLEYLKSIGGEFKFNDVTLKHYFSEDELTETQVIMLKVLKEQGFILAGDETLQRLIQEDYKSMRYKKAKEDMKKIGISLNKQNKIEGVNYKVHEIGNQELFDMAYKLLE